MKLKDLEPKKLMRKNEVYLNAEKLPEDFLLNCLPRKVIKNILNEYAEFEIKNIKQGISYCENKEYHNLYIEVE